MKDIEACSDAIFSIVKNLSRTISKRSRHVLHCVWLLVLLLAAFAHAQTNSAFRLQAGSLVARSGGVPILDRHGECAAWRTGSGLTLLDHKGKNVAEIKGTFLKHWASANGNVIAVLEKIAGDKDGNEESFLTLRWLDRNGRQMGSYNFSQHSDDPLPQILFNTTGSHLVIAQPAVAKLIFFNNNGQTLRESFTFAEAPYSQERPFFMAASTEAFVVLSQSMPWTSSNAVVPVCIRLSTSGEEQWRRELPAGTAGGLAISDDGELIVASRYIVDDANDKSRVESTISLLQRDGKLLANVDGLFRQAIFAQDHARLLLMDRRQLRAIDIPSGKLLWQTNLSRRAEMFVDIAANTEQDKVVALVGTSAFKENRFVFEKARLLGFDNRGRQQFEMPVKTALSSPALVISEDGQRLTLAADGLLQNFTFFNTAK